MTAIRYALREKNYHSDRKRLARLRCLYWIAIRRWETETCGRCGGPVAIVWWCFDQPLWDRVNGGYAGTLCVCCFDEMARDRVGWIEWAPLNLRHLADSEVP